MSQRHHGPTAPDRPTIRRHRLFDGRLILCAVLCLLSIAMLCRSDVPAPSGEEEPEPFAELDKETQRDLRWGFDNQSLARMFNAERDRLGEDFDGELIRFVGTNARRHYWCAAFLDSRSYLQGRAPRRYLSQLLYEQGLHLEATSDKPSLSEKRSFHHLLAIGYIRMGMVPLAVHHKRQAERLFEKGAGGPATGVEEGRLYESIPDE